jgi:hypothetical protein
MIRGQVSSDYDKSIHDEELDRDEGCRRSYTMRSLIVTKVVVAPKLRGRELRLNCRKGNRLKGEKAVQSS